MAQFLFVGFHLVLFTFSWKRLRHDGSTNCPVTLMTRLRYSFYAVLSVPTLSTFFVSRTVLAESRR